MTRRRPWAALGLVAAVALLAAGCLGVPDQYPLRAAPPGAVAGGSATIGIERPVSLDPSNADVFDRSGYLVMSTLCDPLIGRDPVKGQLVPALANTWSVSDSGQLISLTLRPGLRFSDGTALSALDVAATLTRVASQDQASPAASLLSHVVGYGYVHGDELANRPQQREMLEGVSVISDTTVDITLDQPEADFIDNLTSLALTPVPKALAKDNPAALERDPVCVGPYRLAAPYSVQSDTLSLVRSASYYGASAVDTRGGKGYLDRIVFRVGASGSQLAQDYRAGLVDAAPIDPADARGLGHDALSAPTGAVEYLGLPTRTAPFDMLAVRVAFSQALDRAAIVQGAMEGAGLPAASVLPPTMPGPLARAGCPTVMAPASGDVAAARATLDQAGVSLAGRSISLAFDDENGNRAIASAEAAQLEAAFGLRVSLVPMGWPAYLATSQQPGFTTPFRWGWGAPVADPDQFLAPLFSTISIGNDNVSRISDPVFDQALDRVAHQATDDRARAQVYAGLARSLCRTMAMVPVAYRTATEAVNRAALASAGGTLTDRTTGLLLVRELYQPHHAGGTTP